MLIGYVSDERYVALADVALEFLDSNGRSWEARSRASGSIHVVTNVARFWRALPSRKISSWMI